MVSDSEYLKRVFWMAAYNECGICSSYDERFPATYEVWYELVGKMWADDRPAPFGNGPACSLTPKCVQCTADARAEAKEDEVGPYGMKLILIRPLYRSERQSD